MTELGQADDLVRVTDIARAIVTRYGMTARLGHVALEKEHRSLFAFEGALSAPRERAYSDETAADIDAEVKRIVDQVFERTVNLLDERRNLLERLAKHLLEQETLDEQQIRELAVEELSAQPENQASKISVFQG
jgi:cell division protease FtsH